MIQTTGGSLLSFSFIQKNTFRFLQGVVTLRKKIALQGTKMIQSFPGSPTNEKTVRMKQLIIPFSIFFLKKKLPTAH